MSKKLAKRTNKVTKANLRKISKIIQHRENNVSNVAIIIDGTHYHKQMHRKAAEAIAILADKAVNDKDAYLELIRSLNPFHFAVKSGIISRADNGDIYFADVPFPVTDKFSKVLIDSINKGASVKSLAKFWVLCNLNPNREAAAQLFDYCLTYGVTITQNGLLVLYKAVTHKNPVEDVNKDLQAYVAERVHNIKTVQKKSLKHYSLYKLPSGEYLVQRSFKDGKNIYPKEMNKVKAKKVGRLDKLFNNVTDLQTSYQYTDKHSGTMDIRIGVPVTMDRHLCDPNINRECSKGLHGGSYQYVNWFADNSDTILGLLVNPMDIVAIPKSDTSKLRMCEYFPYTRIERSEDGTWDEIPSTFFEADYLNISEQRIKDAIEYIRNRKFLGAGETEAEDDDYDNPFNLDMDDVMNSFESVIKDIYS